MAVLSDADRRLVSEDFCRFPTNVGGTASGLLKANVKAAIDAADQWVEDNSTSFNNALPQPARGALSAKQKAALLVWVVRRRFEVA